MRTWLWVFLLAVLLGLGLWLKKIASGCMECHKAEQVFVKAEKHKPDAWAIAYEEKLCTECHGQHRLPMRKCKWK